MLQHPEVSGTLGAHDGVVVVEGARHTVEVGAGGEEDANVEDLVGATPDVELPGERSLGPAGLGPSE